MFHTCLSVTPIIHSMFCISFANGVTELDEVVNVIAHLRGSIRLAKSLDNPVKETTVVKFAHCLNKFSVIVVCNGVLLMMIQSTRYEDLPPFYII